MDEIIGRISKVPPIQRLIGVALLIIVLVVGNYLIVVSPVEDDIAASDKRIRALDASLVQKRAIARDLRRYRVEVERLKQRLNEALSLLPNQAEIPELLQKIAALVEQSDCEMARFEPQSEIVSGFYAKIPVKMAISGNYHSIAVFFDKVAKLSRIVNISEINLLEPRVVNKKIMLDAEFIATTFKFVERTTQVEDKKKSKTAGKGTKAKQAEEEQAK